MAEADSGERKKGYDIIYRQTRVKEGEERKVGEKQTVKSAGRHGMSACLSFPVTGPAKNPWIDLRVHYLHVLCSLCLIKRCARSYCSCA